MQDPFEVLGLSRLDFSGNVPVAEKEKKIGKAFRDLMRSLHPDMGAEDNQENHQRIADASNAKEWLLKNCDKSGFPDINIAQGSTRDYEDNLRWVWPPDGSGRPEGWKPEWDNIEPGDPEQISPADIAVGTELYELNYWSLNFFSPNERKYYQFLTVELARNGLSRVVPKLLFSILKSCEPQTEYGRKILLDAVDSYFVRRFPIAIRAIISNLDPEDDISLETASKLIDYIASGLVDVSELATGSDILIGDILNIYMKSPAKSEQMLNRIILAELLESEEYRINLVIDALDLNTENVVDLVNILIQSGAFRGDPHRAKRLIYECEPDNPKAIEIMKSLRDNGLVFPDRYSIEFFDAIGEPLEIGGIDSVGIAPRH